ncbi:MAG TPA: bifunctional histidinol-phosphatase/imidazoleglycerol-phosphate dehydratase, partial [Puia sp.]|nr:bifunctional histidinol-phosphatase/imidazoleglycerol-phosphate dehydratase [Puia sp.]
MKRILFIDRDGTLIKESPPTYQIDDLSKLEFYPGVFEYMGRIAREMQYELVMVTNQDGLGSSAFPENKFWPIQDFVMQCFSNES